ncbi:hypothetical protein [Marinicellulosiphila megalodicopiae]|uniref:hypothetical protein n=1 Tax=Marinicellulosiphila megalodicopiae TaxID=2724896 RepID=UPI003BAE4362
MLIFSASAFIYIFLKDSNQPQKNAKQIHVKTNTPQNETITDFTTINSNLTKTELIKQKTKHTHSHSSINIPNTHITELNQSLENNLSVNGVTATTKKDGTVILHSQDRLKTISVAHKDEHGNLVFSEFNQTIPVGIKKDTQ